jgi:hypothetical protein
LQFARSYQWRGKVWIYPAGCRGAAADCSIFPRPRRRGRLNWYMLIRWRGWQTGDKGNRVHGHRVGPGYSHGRTSRGFLCRCKETSTDTRWKIWRSKKAKQKISGCRSILTAIGGWICVHCGLAMCRLGFGSDFTHVIVPIAVVSSWPPLVINDSHNSRWWDD